MAIFDVEGMEQVAKDIARILGAQAVCEHGCTIFFPGRKGFFGLGAKPSKPIIKIIGSAIIEREGLPGGGILEGVLDVRLQIKFTDKNFLYNEQLQAYLKAKTAEYARKNISLIVE